jgi:hypothetical protein
LKENIQILDVKIPPLPAEKKTLGRSLSNLFASAETGSAAAASSEEKVVRSVSVNLTNNTDRKLDFMDNSMNNNNGNQKGVQPRSKSENMKGNQEVTNIQKIAAARKMKAVDKEGEGEQGNEEDEEDASSLSSFHMEETDSEDEIPMTTTTTTYMKADATTNAAAPSPPSTSSLSEVISPTVTTSPSSTEIFPESSLNTTLTQQKVSSSDANNATTGVSTVVTVSAAANSAAPTTTVISSSTPTNAATKNTVTATNSTNVTSSSTNTTSIPVNNNAIVTVDPTPISLPPVPPPKPSQLENNPNPSVESSEQQHQAEDMMSRQLPPVPIVTSGPSQSSNNNEQSMQPQGVDPAGYEDEEDEADFNISLNEYYIERFEREEDWHGEVKEDDATNNKDTEKLSTKPTPENDPVTVTTTAEQAENQGFACMAPKTPVADRDVVLGGIPVCKIDCVIS